MSIEAYGVNEKGKLVVVGIVASHGRFIKVGQLWQSNDPRKLKAIRIVRVYQGHGCVDVKHLDTGNVTSISVKAFTIGQRGWSLLKEADRERQSHFARIYGARAAA